MNTRTTAVALIAVAMLATLTACDGDDDKAAAAKPSEAPTVSAADRDAAREAAGLPPEPTAEARTAYLDALNAIDTRIIKPGKEDQAVSRGLNQCGSIKTTKDRAKLIKLTLSRFTIDTRLPEISNEATGGKVLDAVHKNLCPDF
ncbi:hypothetical protein E6R18_15715 [Streptomyces sp. A1277]|uniref:hypothetical protein n=1 Tax=Streptomyces sp. A1277 TaxID=2563103 RepID=UPI0010A255A7|nr:hypothetical protein [Streptomyces sp. A1277]THA31779.1 hypothetical protein E6R18_15715 [Streptomyces sp. A1277]